MEEGLEPGFGRMSNERGAAGKLLCQVGAGGFHSEDQSLYLQCLAHLVSLLLLGILE